jgi:hypothetical protein
MYWNVTTQSRMEVLSSSRLRALSVAVTALRHKHLRGRLQQLAFSIFNLLNCTGTEMCGNGEWATGKSMEENVCGLF